MDILAIVIVIALLLVFLAFRYQSKLEKEKAEGKWDFILGEFLPYLQSHSEPVRTTEELLFISYNGKGTAKFKGKVHYNRAGVLVERVTGSEKLDTTEFFRGKDEPSKFKPLFESSLFSVTENGDSIILHLKTSSIDRRELTIKQAPDYLFEALKEVLGDRVDNYYSS